MAAVAPAAASSVSFASGHYHFSVANVGRGSGAPVVAKAAYRSGECLYDERIGQFFDYRYGAERVIDSFVMARENAPAWMQHAPREVRQRAWNEAERADDNPKARIATELVVGLPHELTAEQRKNLLSGFVRRLVEKHGVFADVAMHTAHDERNIHSHILLSHRELGPDGFGDYANRHTITRKHRGQVKEMVTFGIASTKSDVKFLRKEWADHVNSAYQRGGLDIRVDHRSFKDRGLQYVPTIHLGPKASELERRGFRTDRGDTNRIIEFGNAELKQLEAEKKRQDAEIIDLQAKLAERLAQQAAKATVDDIRPQTPGQENTRTGGPENGRQPHLEQRSEAATDGNRRKPRQPESEDMDDDIIVTQRQQRQAQEDREAAIYNDMVGERNRADRFIQEWQIAHENGERNRRTLQEAQWRREAEGDITDVRTRALLAAGESRDFVQAVRREGAMITAEHADLQRDIALEQDPDKKHLLELKRDIQHADYMALTNERIAAMSNLNGEQYKDALRQQETWADIGTDLRKERLELQERMADQQMDIISQGVEQMAARINAAHQQRAEFRGDIRGNPPAAHFEAEQQEQAAPETPRAAAKTTGQIIEESHKAHEAAAAENVSPTEQLLRDVWDKGWPEEKGGGLPPIIHLPDQSQPVSPPGSPATPATEPERPAEVIHLGPTAPQHQPQEPTQENTDARQADSATAENTEITDSKAAKKAALAQMRAETEQAIQHGQERGHGHSR